MPVDTAMKRITVPAVAAALLTVPRDCETCGNRRWQDIYKPMVVDGIEVGGGPFFAGIKPCPDCRMVCEWVAVDDSLEVGSTVQIAAGPAPVVSEFGPYVICWDETPTFTEAIERDGVMIAPLRPGEVVATGVVTECVPIWPWSYGHDSLDPHICVDATNGQFLRYPGSVEDQHGDDISDQRLDQDWSPTLTACPSCGSVDMFIVRPPCSLDAYDPHRWHIAGTLPRYAIRLTDVETPPNPEEQPT